MIVEQIIEFNGFHVIAIATICITFYYSYKRKLEHDLKKGYKK